jgi:hypothetical protein
MTPLFEVVKRVYRKGIKLIISKPRAHTTIDAAQIRVSFNNSPLDRGKGRSKRSEMSQKVQDTVVH